MDSRDFICRWCGYQAETEDDIEGFDVLDERGFWCPDCNNFSYFSPADESRRRMLLIVESGGVHSEEPVQKTALRKRLSPLRYSGGKSRMVDQIFGQLMHNKLETFVELFAGGASLRLSLLDAGVIQKLVLNDLDPMAYAFWDSILHAPGYLLARLDRFVPDMDAFFEAKDILNRVLNGRETVSQDILAWSFFLLNRTCFGGILAARPICGRDGSNARLLARWNAAALKARIERVHQMADRIQVFNMEAEDFLLNSDYWWEPHTTFFIDLPYIKMGDKLYTEKFPEKKHVSLAESLNALCLKYPNPDIIITYDDCLFVRDMYPYAEVCQIQRSYRLPQAKRSAS